MTYAAPASPHANGVAKRRTLAGLLLSLFVHAVILSIRFGLPGRLAGAPIVSVAVRSDGSIDEVTILRSSGRADTDDTVRRIVHLDARHAAFRPALRRVST